MREIERNKFNDGMVQLRNCYGAFFGDAAEWGARLASYFEQLRDQEFGDVAEGLKRAPGPDFFPDRFPTAGQLKRLTITAKLERATVAAEARRKREEMTEDDKLREEFDLLPLGEAAQRDYIDDAPTPFDRLAREWQCESRRLNLDPTKPSPPEIQERRLREFWALWAEREPQVRPASREFFPAPTQMKRPAWPGREQGETS